VEEQQTVITGRATSSKLRVGLVFMALVLRSRLAARSRVALSVDLMERSLVDGYVPGPV
jgi:hypothetical protein